MNSEAQHDPLPLCASMAEIRSFNKKQVRLVGTYHSAALYKGPKRKGIDPVQAVIRLDDGTKVLLEPNWSRRFAARPGGAGSVRQLPRGSRRLDSYELPGGTRTRGFYHWALITSVRSIRLLSEEGDL